MPAALLIHRGPGEGSMRSLDVDEFFLGRSSDSDIVLLPNSVGREHARIVRVQNQHYIIDGDTKGQPSRNHTFVNEVQVPTTPTALKHNDQIRIGDCFLASFLAEPEDNSTVEASLPASAHTLLDSQPAEKLRHLLEISAGLSRTLDREPLLTQLADGLLRLFRQADRCFVIEPRDPVRAGDRPVLWPRLVRTRPTEDASRARPGETFVRRCLEKCEALLIEDVLKEPAGQGSDSLLGAGIRSVMCVPLLRADGTAFGVIQLDTLNRSKFKEEDLKLFAGVANQASIALENARLLQEAVLQAKMTTALATAREVQLRFLPRTLPKVPAYEFHSLYQPAQSVGGDYYGFIPMNDGRLVVALGDVSGKGIPAALLMAMLSSELRHSVVTVPNPADIVDRTNDLVYPFTTPELYVTLCLVLLDPAGHGHLLMSAGHPSPELYDPKTGTLRPLRGTGGGSLPLGIVEGNQYGAVPLQLEPGQILLMYSDGLPDAENTTEEKLGMKRVRDAVTGLGNASAKTLIETIRRAVEQHATSREPFDDLTLVAVRRTA